MRESVALAFSGGLDTTYCAKYLSEVKGLTVHSVTVDTGGFSKHELAKIEEGALELGVASHTVLDVTSAFYRDCLRYLIFGNVLRNNTYPLCVSAERIFQAIAVAKFAEEKGCAFVAHGSTGAGNDQVRFDMAFHTLCPGIKILTPIRDQRLSREDEIHFLQEAGVVRDWVKAQYSINKGLWGTSVGGRETLTSDGVLPEEAWPTAVSKSGSETITIGFQGGEVKVLNGRSFDNPVELIQSLEALAAPYGVGREVHVGDTIIGIKGRVAFQASAAMVLLKAHHALEKHCLTKSQQSLKEPLSQAYGSLVHEGHFLDPAIRAIEAFFEATQVHVSGEVDVRLSPHHFFVLGIRSKSDLMASNAGQYGEMNAGWSGEDVRGFAKIACNQTLIYHRMHAGPEVLK